jgi:hypothetical protein
LRHALFCRLKTAAGNGFRFWHRHGNAFAASKISADFPSKTGVKNSGGGTVFAASIQEKIIFKCGIALANEAGVG